MAPLSVIEAVVVNESGEPQGNIAIAAYSSTLVGNGVSDSDGRIIIRGFGESSDEVTLRSDDDRFDISDRQQRLRWGDARRRIVVIPRTSLRIRVLDSVTTRAIEDYRVRLVRSPHEATRWTSDDGQLVHPGPHSQGTLIVGFLAGGEYLLTVFPTDSKYGRSPEAKIQIKPRAENVIDIYLKARALLSVKVVHDSALPVTGAQIEILERQAAWPEDSIDVTTQAVPVEDLYVKAFGRGIAVVVDTQATGADGIALCRVPAGETAFAIRVKHPDYAPALVDGVFVRDAEQHTTVTLQGGCRIVGRVEPREVFLTQVWRPDQRLGVVLRSTTDRASWWPRASEEIPLSKDGLLEAGGVPPGRYEVLLVRSKIGSFVSDRTVGHWALAVFSAIPGRESELLLSASLMLGNRLEGRIRYEGSRNDLPGLQLAWVEQRGSDYTVIRSRPIAVGADGLFSECDLDCGAYVLCVPAKHGSCPFGGPFVLSGGQTTSVSCDLYVIVPTLMLERRLPGFVSSGLLCNIVDLGTGITCWRGKTDDRGAIETALVRGREYQCNVVKPGWEERSSGIHFADRQQAYQASVRFVAEPGSMDSERRLRLILD
jgi:hypothetical protein